MVSEFQFKSDCACASQTEGSFHFNLTTSSITQDMSVITLDENSFARSVAGYLYEKGCFESLNSILLEANLGIFEDLPEEFLTIQRFVLQGRWSEVVTCLGPFCDVGTKFGKQVHLLIGKQQFLECLSWQGGGSDRWIFPPWKPNQQDQPVENDTVDLNILIGLLNKVKPLCSVPEFNSLCLFLTLERLEDHPEYNGYTVAEGRFKTAEQLISSLLEVFQLGSAQSLSTAYPGILFKLAGKGIEVLADVHEQNPIFKSQSIGNDQSAIHVPSLSELAPLLTRNGRITSATSPRIALRDSVKTQKRFSSAKEAYQLSGSFHQGFQQVQALAQESDQLMHAEEKQPARSLEFGQTVAWPRARAGQSSLGGMEDLGRGGVDPNDSRASTASTGSRKTAPSKPAAAWTVDFSSDGGHDDDHSSRRATDGGDDLDDRGHAHSQMHAQSRPTTSGSSKSRGGELVDLSDHHQQPPSQHSHQPHSARSHAPATSSAVDSFVQDSHHHQPHQQQHHQHQNHQQPPQQQQQQQSIPVFSPVPTKQQQQQQSRQSAMPVSTPATMMSALTSPGLSQLDISEHRGGAGGAGGGASVVSAASAMRSPGMASPYTKHTAATALSTHPAHPAAPAGAGGAVGSPASSHRSGQSHATAQQSGKVHSEVSRAEAKARGASVRKGVLWDEGNPLRCISVIGEDGSDGDAQVTVAVGSNNRHVHLLRFRPSALERLAEVELRASGEALAGDWELQSRIVHDLTSQVEVLYSFEKLHGGSVYAMDYSDAHEVLLTGSNDKSLRLLRPWRQFSHDRRHVLSEQPVPGSLSTPLKGHTGTVRVVKFAPSSGGSDDLWAASAGAGDYRARLWDLQQESCVRLFHPHSSTIHGLCWLDAHTLVTGCEEGLLVAHDTRSKVPVYSVSLTELVSPAQDDIAAVSRSVCALSVFPSLQQLQRDQHSFLHRQPGVFVPQALQHVVAVGSTSGALSFVELQHSGGPTLSHPHANKHAHLLVDLPRAHSGEVRSLLPLPLHFDATPAPTVDKQPALFFSGSYDMTSVLWQCQLARRRVDPALQVTSALPGTQGRWTHAHQDKILSAANLKHGRSVITTGADGRVVLWNL